MNEINIFTDGGRCCRPLYIVQNNKLVITKKDSNIEKHHYDFRNLLLKVINNANYSSIEDTRQTNKIPCIEYLDTEESYYKMIGTYKDLKSKTKYKRYTHCEIHPSLMGTAIITYSIFKSQSVSEKYLSVSAGKQAMGIYMTNFTIGWIQWGISCIIRISHCRYKYRTLFTI